MSIIQAIPLLLLLAVALVNIVTLILWHSIYRLVRATDPLIGDETGAVYARYIFGQLMEGGYLPSRRMESLGNPTKDQVIRSVKSSDGYAIVASIASAIKHVPLNFVLMFKQ